MIGINIWEWKKVRGANKEISMEGVYAKSWKS